MVSSPLERCQETAKALLASRNGTAFHTDDRLGEVRYGDWTGQPLKELSKDKLWKVVQAHPSAVVFPGDDGEGLAAMQTRAVAAVREWNTELGDDAVYAVVSHADVIKSILADALGQHLDQFQRIVVDPASLSVVRTDRTRPFVERINDTGGAVDGSEAEEATPSPEIIGRRRGRRGRERRMIHEYVEPARFVAGTVGPPGQRTFFLQAHDGRRTTSVSLEKAQVAVLAERMDELLDTLVGKAVGSCRSLRWCPQTSKTVSRLSRPSTTSSGSCLSV